MLRFSFAPFPCPTEVSGRGGVRGVSLGKAPRAALCSGDAAAGTRDTPILACPELQDTPQASGAFHLPPLNWGFVVTPGRGHWVCPAALDGNPSAWTPRVQKSLLLPVSHLSQCHGTGRGGRDDSWQGDTPVGHWRSNAISARCAKPSSPPAQQWACARRGHWPCPRLAAASATC